MEVAIIGAGALGTLFGGLLADAGHDVRLVHHREAYVKELNRHGVQIRGDALARAPLSVDVPATTDASDIGPVDLCLVLVRSYQTREALREHGACIGEDTRVLTLQNGLTNYDIVREAVGDERALGGTTFVGAEVESPGVVRATNVGQTTLGGPDTAFAERLRRLFGEASLDVTIVDDPRPYIWDKQMVSIAFKPLAALTRLSNGPIVRDEALLAIIEEVIAEARAVARARGIRLLTDDPVGRVVDVGRKNPEHRSSMLQDVTAGRKTEIDDMNGAIVSYAKEEEVAAPYNRVLTSLVRALERGYLDDA